MARIHAKATGPYELRKYLHTVGRDSTRYHICEPDTQWSNLVCRRCLAKV